MSSPPSPRNASLQPSQPYDPCPEGAHHCDLHAICERLRQLQEQPFRGQLLCQKALLEQYREAGVTRTWFYEQLADEASGLRALQHPMRGNKVCYLREEFEAWLLRTKQAPKPSGSVEGA